MRSMTPLEAGLGADGQLDDRGHGLQPVLDHLDGPEEVGADAVHLVDEADPRDLVAVGLAPHRLGLRLDAGDGVEHRHRAVEHPQRALHLDGEVHVARGVDDVDAVVVPHAGGGRGGDGDAPLLLLDHVVHHGRALVHLADLVGLPRVVEDPLGRRGLARVDVGHDPDVAGPVEGEFTLGHGSRRLLVRVRVVEGSGGCSGPQAGRSSMLPTRSRDPVDVLLRTEMSAGDAPSVALAASLCAWGAPARSGRGRAGRGGGPRAGRGYQR